ncbi:MAG: sulfite exporter TauE/SafE family protein [Candidatus Sericytochromatia bacterium]|nr:sulfite exporter TauE/SafE family protein [Candidatus Sericytochromatia bacterium]
MLAVVAFGGALLTFFSGFGLGTVLLPAFALFFPPGAAVAATAVVHLATNVFKWGLVRQAVEWPVARQFALAAIPAALCGAWLLGWLSLQTPWYSWTVAGHTASVTPLKGAVGGLVVAFALLELIPPRQLPRFESVHLAWGGLLSGFFGGLSGHQGALRSLFLLRVGLPPASFVATGVAIAVAVDLSRLLIYGGQLRALSLDAHATPVGVAIAGAFAGAWLGSRWLHKVTIQWLQRIVATLLVVYGGALAAGLI